LRRRRGQRRPVSDDYPAGRNAFTAGSKGVQLDITGAESFDHLVDPEDAIRIAMARQ